MRQKNQVVILFVALILILKFALKYVLTYAIREQGRASSLEPRLGFNLGQIRSHSLRYNLLIFP